MAYEVFKRTATRVGTPTLAITPDGRIVVNAAGIRILKEASVKSVLLLWDKDSCRLAIKATRKEDKNAYAVSIASGNHSGGIRAKSFLTHIGWNAPERESVTATWNESERMFEVELPSQYVSLKKSGNPKPKS